MKNCLISGRFKQNPRSHVIVDLLFADDCGLNSSSKADLQKSVNWFFQVCSNFILTTNTEVTKIMYQIALYKTCTEPTIKLNVVKLKVVIRFTYLCRTLSQTVNIEDEFLTRMSKHSSTFGWQSTNIWHRSGVSLQIKLKDYRVAVPSVLLYTWRVCRHHAKKPNHIHTVCLI